ncbi:MAG: alpha/beta hydrolase [Lachnospiraceae bacterium]|jgi:pimeloyl-ACP methyl ester carboxylesterase|nr:alpha/beta hydrolase [Lachnospiraceae bacterium]
MEKRYGKTWLNDIEVPYIISGKGKPVILLHGWQGNYKNFGKMIDILSEHFKVYSFNSRERINASWSWDKSITLDMLKEDISEFMKVMNIEKPSLIGYSDGANLALKFAIEDKDKIDKIVAISPNTSPFGLRKPFLFSYILGDFFANIQYRLIHFFSKKSLIEILAYRFKLLTDLIIVEPHITTDELKNISTPTFLIFGQWDSTGKKDIYKMKTKIKNATTMTLAGGFHTFMLKYYKRYIHEIIDFLN